MSQSKRSVPATWLETATAKWAEWKPILIGVAVGLVAGPVISGISGFQVRTSTAEAAAHQGIVAQQASFCAERARATLAAGAVPGDWQARSALAGKWSTMPGDTIADPEVTYACANKLSG